MKRTTPATATTTAPLAGVRCTLCGTKTSGPKFVGGVLLTQCCGQRVQ
jgi:hypothetical protein